MRSDSCVLVAIVVVVMIVAVMIPIVLGLPTMFSPVPPLVILTPAAFALGIKVAAAVFGCAAVLAVVGDGAVQSGLRFLDGVLAPAPVIGVCRRRSSGDE